MMNYTTSSFVTIFLLLFEAFSLSAAVPPASSTDAKEMAKFKARVMSADYRADFKELAAVRDELAKWPDTRDLAYLARYWSGFASWRIALNGANHDMKQPELLANLKSAAADFFDSMRLKDDFADAYVAASMVNAWLINLDNDMKERLAVS